MGWGDDLVGSLLGDKAPKAAEPTKSNPEYYLAKSLGGDAGATLSVAPGADPNTADGGSVEFIHFGRVHPDARLNFHHPELPDDRRADIDQTGGQPVPEGAPKPVVSKAIMFRAALQREAILLTGFVSGAKQVVDSAEGGKGALGEAMGAIGSLMGGGGGAAQGPDKAEYDRIMKDASTAGGLANQAAIHYKDLHKAGKDLRQARGDHKALSAKFLDKYKDGKASGGGAGNLLSGGLSSLGPLPGGELVKTITGLLFKAQDIHAAIYFSMREEAEEKIAAACYAMSLKSIEDRFLRPFPVWFYRACDNPAPAGPGAAGEDAGGNVVERKVKEAVNAVNEKIDEAKQKVDSTKKSVQDLLGVDTGEEKMAGEAFLASAFAGLSPIGDQMPVVMGKVIGVDALPGVVEWSARQVVTANLGMMQVVYTKLMRNRGEVALEEEFLRTAGREYLFRTLIELLAKATGAGFLQDGGLQSGVPGVGQVDGAKLAKEKAASLANSALGSKLGFLLDLAVKDAGAKLEAARVSAAAAKSSTMEVYLGQLPWLFALMFRNTFFPVWDLIADTVFGGLGGAAGAAMNPVKGFLGSVEGAGEGVQDGLNDANKKVDDTVKDVTDTAAKVKKKTENVDLIKAAQDPSSLTDLGDDPESAAPEPDKPKPPPPPFPGGPRITTGEGILVGVDEMNEVDRNQKVEAKNEDPGKDY
jgi:hypothetical protein